MAHRVRTGITLLMLSLLIRAEIVRRSFDETVQECAQLLSIDSSKMVSLRYGTMPNDDDTKRLLRCVGVNARFWSDHTGLRKDMLARYFLADAFDRQNVNRTQICLDRLPSLPVDPAGCRELAYKSFLCFYLNYGNLRRERVFVPLDHLQLLHVAARCMDVHQIAPADLMSLSTTEMDGNAKVHCLVRCIGIRTGVYTDRQGVNVELMYGQYGEGYNESDFKADAFECLRRQRANHSHSSSPCGKAYHSLYKCFENVRNVITEYEMRDSSED
ncbi:general odorant-binding protein 45-like [Anopheles nili]|uniref:general odorant-binding protein 45-like n=1 Tax=Anopheles nili TaxID=185578 RepID=UPI00237BA682|nr:general odorant-binding protein 45-like [Anopheles nili]